MNKKLKCMEYYFDSKKYNEIDVIEKIGLKKMEFPKKKSSGGKKRTGHFLYRLQRTNGDCDG